MPTIEWRRRTGGQRRSHAFVDDMPACRYSGPSAPITLFRASGLEPSDGKGVLCALCEAAILRMRRAT